MENELRVFNPWAQKDEINSFTPPFHLCLCFETEPINYYNPHIMLHFDTTKFGRYSLQNILHQILLNLGIKRLGYGHFISMRSGNKTMTELPTWENNETVEDDRGR